ncbi:uncharacterized protein LODBEIA_P23400 [Lodderomyces beijingensis]|uniref:Zn(2)-C6 fungal-type domain-containing protein n=1 Tax=Lodderomyces beijingensis TaxID=1775926 RepID=A0ABP0ZMK4_9ASCO
MSDILPISCVSCRRRKIKCNKKKPCDQCIKRQLVCDFPATFRNIKITEDDFIDDNSQERDAAAAAVNIQPPEHQQLYIEAPASTHPSHQQYQHALQHQHQHQQQMQHQQQLQNNQYPLQQQQQNQLYQQHLHNQQLQENLKHQAAVSAAAESQLQNRRLPPLPLQGTSSASSSESTSSTSVLSTRTDKTSTSTAAGSDSSSTKVGDSTVSPDSKSDSSSNAVSNSSEGCSDSSLGTPNSGMLPISHPISSFAPATVGNQSQDNFEILKENFDMMRAANSQLLDQNRELTQRLEEIMQKITVSDNDSNNQSMKSQSVSSNPGSNSSGSNKRERTSDSSSEDLPYKKEKVGFFGHSKASFPNDSASANQGMYSTNVPNGDAQPKESSSTSSGGSSGDEVGQQISSEAQPLAREQKNAQQQRKLHKLKQRNRSLSHGDHNANDWEKEIDTYHTQESIKSNRMAERSSKKKRLPILPSYLLKYEDPDISTDSDTIQDVLKLNFEVIVTLVQNFFDRNPYYRTFISANQVFGFLKNYELISDRDWDNDDDLLLLYMILSLSIQRLSPKDFVDLNLLPAGSINTCTKYRKFLTRNVLHKNFERLRNGLINESLMSIQAYILCTEWFFLEQKYEQCWTMMFHACSISYSIGLHIMGNYKLSDARTSKQQFNLISATAEDSDVSDKKETMSGSEEDDKTRDEESDITRSKLWFALKYYVSVVCSIFGRPNPVSVQVGINGSNSSLGSEIPDKSAHILLKVGVSESLRLSNLMLIENFMIDFTLPDLLNLSKKFDKEIKFLEVAYEDETLGANSGDEEDVSSNEVDYLTRDEYTGQPARISSLELLSDIIVVYINNAKLYEPFISKLENVEGYDQVLKNQVNSVSKFLVLLNVFVEKFLKHYVSENLRDVATSGSGNNVAPSSEDDSRSSSSSSGHSGGVGGQQALNYGPVKFGKLFKTYFPFVNSFICQGIIVVFTLLHYKSKEFVANDKNSIINNEFLGLIEENLNSLLNFESRLSTKYITTSRMWSSNMVYLINRVLNLIKLLYEKQEDDSLGEELKARKDDKSSSSTSKSNDSSPDNVQMNLPITTARGNLSYLLNTNPFGDPSQFEYLNGFHLNDPFWLTVPDNLPYYLGSPPPADDISRQQNRSIAGFKYNPNPQLKSDSSIATSSSGGSSASANDAAAAAASVANNAAGQGPMLSQQQPDMFELGTQYSNWNDPSMRQQTPTTSNTPNLGVSPSLSNTRKSGGTLSSGLPPPIIQQPPPPLSTRHSHSHSHGHGHSHGHAHGHGHSHHRHQQPQPQQPLPSLPSLSATQAAQQPPPPQLTSFMGGGYMFPQQIGYSPSQYQSTIDEQQQPPPSQQPYSFSKPPTSSGNKMEE